MKESQGRGTLHLHALLWLAGAPNSNELSELLHTEDFRERVKAFISQTCRASVDGVFNIQDLDAVPTKSDVAYCRPPNPASNDYNTAVADLERQVACTKQRHKCTIMTCLLASRTGALACKRRAPWPLSAQDRVDEDGHWLPRRHVGCLNTWNPSVTINVRGNNDIKLLTNGQVTRGLTFYVSMYATKKQGKSYNTSAL